MQDDKFKKEMRRIGKTFHFLRIRGGFKNAQEFALKFELIPAQYRRIEKGIGNPTFKTFVKICAAHNMTFEEIFRCKIE